MSKFKRKLIDALITSIPLFIMVILAGITWWLVLITPEPEKIVISKLRENEPDLIINNFVVERYDLEGAMRSNLKGVQAKQFPLSDTIVIDKVDLMTTESLDKLETNQPALGSGEEFFRITALSDQGVIYNSESIIELLDNAYVTRQPLYALGNKEKVEFRGDELRILVDEKRMVSDKPVDITQDGNRATSDRMIYYYETETVEMRGNVRNKFVDEE